MEIPDFVDQLIQLKEKEFEQRTWELWLVKYPYMTEDDFVTYEEMLNTTRETKEEEVGQEVVANGVYANQVFL